MSKTERREIIELQERLAFLEHTLEQVNRVVANQQLEIDRLSEDLRELRRQATKQDGAQGGADRPRSLEDDRPPHY